jgi:hypothetical protein
MAEQLRKAGKLGKGPTRLDRRTIRLSAILSKGLAPVPSAYDVEVSLSGKQFDGRMWRNDVLGDCVIAGRANQTRIFEYFEQGKNIPINDQDVLYEYFKETGGPDSGLVMLDSLNAWRKGWTVDKKGKCRFFGSGTKYDIHAYAAIVGVAELKQAIFYLRGGYIGFEVPQYAIDQFNANKPWDIDAAGDQKIVGGHCIQFPAYNGNMLECWTWGKRQPMTSDFYNKYVSEAYAIIDNRDSFIQNSPVDAEALEKILQEITSESQTK